MADCCRRRGCMMLLMWMSLYCGCSRREPPKIYQAVDNTEPAGEPAEPAEAEPSDDVAPQAPAESEKTLRVAGPKPAKRPKPTQSPKQRKWTRGNPEDDFRADGVVVEVEKGRIDAGKTGTAMTPLRERFAYVGAAKAGLTLSCAAEVDRTAPCWLWIRTRSASKNTPGACRLLLGTEENGGVSLNGHPESAEWHWMLLKTPEGESRLEVSPGSYPITLQAQGLLIDKILIAFDSPDEFEPRGVTP